MKTKKRTKIVIGMVVVIIDIPALALVAGSLDDSGLRDQAAEKIGKYGYDPEITECEMQRGINVFG